MTANKTINVKGTVTYTWGVAVGTIPVTEMCIRDRPYTQLPSDFNEFWNKTKAEAAQFPLTYTKESVSYTHLDVYKRQVISSWLCWHRRWGNAFSW